MLMLLDMSLMYWLTATTEYAPINQVVVAGRNVTLLCGTDNNSTSQWKHKQEADDESYLIYNQNTSIRPTISPE